VGPAGAGRVHMSMQVGAPHGALWRRSAVWRGTARVARFLFHLTVFDKDYLQKLELKCTTVHIANL
jgi:hypothetical protein